MVQYYTPVNVTGYNANAPSDDGVAEAQNEITWQIIKEDLSDKLKTAIESIDTNLQAAFNKIPWNGINAQSSNYTITTSDLGNLVTMNGAFTVTLLASATATAGFMIGVKNVGTDAVTIDGNLTETIDGSETLVLNDQNDAVVLVSDGTNWQIAAAVTAVVFDPGASSSILASQVFI